MLAELAALWWSVAAVSAAPLQSAVTNNTTTVTTTQNHLSSFAHGNGRTPHKETDHPPATHIVPQVSHGFYHLRVSKSGRRDEQLFTEWWRVEGARPALDTPAEYRLRRTVRRRFAARSGEASIWYIPGLPEAETGGEGP